MSTRVCRWGTILRAATNSAASLALAANRGHDKKHQETEILFRFRDTPKGNSVSVSETLQNGIPFRFLRHSETEFRFRFRITLLYLFMGP